MSNQQNMNYRNILPKFIHTLYMIWQTYKYDCLRNLKYGFAYQHKNENLKANLLMVIHTIEKGLTMPNAHTNFGKDRIYSLIFLVKQLTNNHSDNKNIFEVQYALSTLNDYILFHKMRNKEIEPTLLDCIQQLTQSLSYSLGQDKYAQYFFTNETFFKFAQSDFREFALSRHSVRNYIDEEIPDEILTKVIEIANTSPSSCNRQTCQAYIIKKQEPHTESLISARRLQRIWRFSSSHHCCHIKTNFLLRYARQIAT